MIQLLIGKKGSGKTKHLIELAHEAVKESKGQVVCVEKGDTLTYDVDHKARLINIEDYKIEGFNVLYGFISGLCACNYDITDILVDSTLKIGGKDMEAFEGFVSSVASLAENTKIKFIFSVSAEENEIPEGLKSYILSI